MDHFGKNSGAALIIFLKFCTMKRANRWEKVILMVFTKKICSGEMCHFGPENGTSHNSGLALIFFYIAQ